MESKIEVGKNPNSVYPHPFGPHFWQLHDRHVREMNDGEEAHELPAQRLVDRLAKSASDPVLREAMALVWGNSGMHFRHGAFDAGERSVGKLFSPQRDKKGACYGEMTDGRGQKFIALQKYHMCVLLDLYGRRADDEGKAIYTHITEFLKDAGLEPNMERINSEFCPTCLHGIKSQDVVNATEGAAP